MPTWRNWLEEVSDETFVASDYYRNYMAPSTRTGWRLTWRVRRVSGSPTSTPSSGSTSRTSPSPRPGAADSLWLPAVEPADDGVQAPGHRLPSVCWDVYYQGKPVLFYQFDVEQYNETRGAYIDLEKDLFGDRATTPDELFALLEGGRGKTASSSSPGTPPCGRACTSTWTTTTASAPARRS